MLILQAVTDMHHSSHYLRSMFEAAGGGAVAQWLFSGFVSTMPPYTGQNYFSKWAYAFLHFVAANLDKVHIPGSPDDSAPAGKS